jgi:uncharacterized protein
MSVESLPYLTDAAELRPLYAQPSALVRAKQIDHLGPHCWTFIGRSPMVIIGSMHPIRGVDVSPRGDAPGLTQTHSLHALANVDFKLIIRVSEQARVVAT